LNDVEQTRRELQELGEEVSRMKQRNYNSPDEAFGDLVRVETRLNFALYRLGLDRMTADGLVRTDVADAMEQVIGSFIERTRDIAANFKAKAFSIEVGGFPPRVELSLTWAVGPA
jgi:hypothetical protein